MKNQFWYKSLAPLLAEASLIALTISCSSDSTQEESPIEAADGGADAAEPSPDAAKPSPDAAELSPDAAGPDAGEETTTLPDPVMTENGPVCGVEMMDESGSPTGVTRYLGIPYAAPPVGDLRWKPPQPVESWTEPPACDEWPNRAPQPETEGVAEGLGEISEDCLYLNVMTPAKRADEGLPVMAWFHGGGFSILSGNSPTYCNYALPQQGVVVVAVNHRLGPFGYMAHPALTEESENSASGNYGTLDLIAALEWVRGNIESFGGDPDNVTIFGESGGGGKVISCLASPLAKGLFHRAIVESGSRSAMPEGTTSFEDAEAAGERIATELGVDGEGDVLAAMRAKSWEEVLEASAAGTVGFAANLNVEGWALPDTVYNILQEGKQNDVPLIVGANEGEVTELTETVPNLAAGMSSVSSDAYVYVFSHLPTAWREEGCVAFHGVELPYVFGHIEGLTSATVITLSAIGGCTSPDPGADEMDEEVATNTMALWTQFAATGDPSVEGLVDWPPYETDTDQYLDIGHTLEVKTGVTEAAVEPPAVDQGEPVPYTNDDYGFSLEYPETWAQKTEGLGPGVIWRVGQGSYFVPSVRVIVRDEAEGADLQEVFTAHLDEDGAKTIDSFTETDVAADCTECTQADIEYTGTSGSYEGSILGLVKDGNWIIIEVYTVPGFFAFADEEQKTTIIASVTFE